MKECALVLLCNNNEDNALAKHMEVAKDDGVPLLVEKEWPKLSLTVASVPLRRTLPHAV